MNTELPSEPVGDGRDERGRFGPGNKAGRGNPLAARAQELRVALFRAVGPDDLRAVVATIVTAAKGGDMTAAKLLLDRTLGPAESVDIALRLERLEAELEVARKW